MLVMLRERLHNKQFESINTEIGTDFNKIAIRQ